MPRSPLLRRPIPILLLLAALSGCATEPTGPIPSSVAGDRILYVVDRSWHTDISLPLSELDPPLREVAAYFPGARYLDIGFGDRQYLLSRDTGILDMLRALLPGPGAMLVTGLSATPQEAFGAANVVTLHVSAATLEAIDRYAASYFAPKAGGKIVPLADGPYDGSLFFASDATYGAFHTCNTWVAEALRAGGLPVATKMVVLAGQVMGEVRPLASDAPSALPRTGGLPHPAPLAVDTTGRFDR